MMSKRIVMLCTLGLLMLGTTGQTYASDLQPLTLRLHWLPNAEFAGIFAAKDRGWYKEAGIDLQIKNMDYTVSSVDAVLAGNADVGMVEGDVLIKARAAGKPVKAFAASFQKSPFCLMSKKGRGIQTLADLKGKRIAITVPEVVPMLEILLRSQELTLDDVEQVRTGIKLHALIDDEVDVYPGFMNDEPFFFRSMGVEVDVMPAFKYGYTFYSNLCFTTETVIREQPEMLKIFTDVTLRGWKAAFHDPQATAAMIVDTYFPDGLVQQQTESIRVFKTLATLGITRDLIGIMEEQTWKIGIDILHRNNQIDKRIPAEEVYTLQFLQS